MNLLFFKKPKLKQILEKYTKLVESEVFQMVREQEDNITKLFDKECENTCKHFEIKEDFPIDRICTHKKGTGICDIWICPLR